MANGDFSSAAIIDSQLLMGQMMADNNNWIRRYKNPKHKTLKALLENQSTFVRGVEDPNKENQVDIHWFDKSSVTADTLTTTCEWTGTEGGTYTQEYDLNDGKEAKFSYTKDEWRTSQYDSPAVYRAAMLIQHSYAIVEAMNTAAIAFLDANLSGANQYLGGNTFNGSDETEIPAALYNPNLWSYIALTKEANDMNEGFIVGGVGLTDVAWKSDMQVDASGRNMVNDTPFYSDVKGFAADTDDPFYLIDPTAYAFASKTRYNSTPIEDELNQIRYSITDPFGLGFNMDVIEKFTCSTDEDIKVDVKIKARYDFFANPTTLLDANNQGILKHVKV